LKVCLVIDPFSGAAGDMLLAAMIDAGVSLDVLRERVLAVPALAKVRMDVESVQRGAFAAKRLVVQLPDEHAHRGLADITRIIDGAPSLSETVRSRAKDAFSRLAMAEARVHGTTVEQVHFHEVGAMDAILDIVGFFVCAELLGIESFFYTNLVLGAGGAIHGAHGDMPVPAPATLELLAGHRIVYSSRMEELMTPTAAAIVASVFAPLPLDARLVQGRVGYGAGTRESSGMPNVLRVSIDQMVEGGPGVESHEVAVIRCTIDDMNPELYGHLMQQLFADGALEIYYTGVIMKKNRPGVEVTVLAEEADADRLGRLILKHTTTLGLRVAREGRVELARRVETLTTEFGEARVKVATLPDGGEKMSPEYESCREIAERTGRSMVDVFDAVKRAWHARAAGRG